MFVGEPKAGHQVCAGGVAGIHIAPLGPCAVHCEAVALHNALDKWGVINYPEFPEQYFEWWGHLGIPECEGGTLTPAVDEGRGRLGLGGRDLGGAGHAEAGEGEAEQQGPGLHFVIW